MKEKIGNLKAVDMADRKGDASTVYQNKKAAVSFDLDEKFVLGCYEENYDIVLNPKKYKKK